MLNVVTTRSTGKVMGPLIADGRIRKLSFTGSTEVGRTLIEQSAQQVLKTSMELGGNAPFVVFADADVDAAVEGAMLAKMRNIGEACTSANRFYVHADVAEEFTKKLADRMGSMTIGRGIDEGVEVGPLVEADQRDKVAELVDDAVQKGAQGASPAGRCRAARATSTRRRCSPTCPPRPAWSRRRSSGRWRRSSPSPRTTTPSARPTTPSSASSATSTRRTCSGRSGSRSGSRPAWSGSTRAWSPTPAAPFGGVKQSGLGREGGDVGIDEYLEIKYVAMNV